MIRIDIRICAALGLAIAGCGGGSGGSGVDASKPITQLTASEVMQFCEWSVEEQGGAGTTTDCGDGVTVTVDTVQECVDGYGGFTSDCTTTVGQVEDCIEAIAADPCSFGGAACAPLFDCYQ